MLILLQEHQGLLLFLITGNHLFQLYTRSYLSIAIGECGVVPANAIQTGIRFTLPRFS